MKLRVFIVLLVFGLVAFIYYRGKNNPKALTGKSTVNVTKSFNFKDYLHKARQQIKDTSLALIIKGEQNVKSNPTAKNYKQLATYWDSLHYPVIAAHYYEMTAKLDSTEKNWDLAAQNYFDAEKQSKDSLRFQYVSAKSINSYLHVMAINPGNLDAKADLAVSYIEGKGEIMKGVGLLKEVVEVDPDNTKALFYLGYLSIRSGQYKKALQRFEHLVSLQPQNPFYYYYLGRVHLAQGDHDKALASFKQYRNLLKDPGLIKDANKMIEDIQSNN